MAVRKWFGGDKKDPTRVDGDVSRATGETSAASARVAEYLEETKAADSRIFQMKAADFETARQILDLPPDQQLDVALATFGACERRDFRGLKALALLREALLSRDLPLDGDRVVELAERFATEPRVVWSDEPVIATFERYAAGAKLPDRTREVLASTAYRTPNEADSVRLEHRVHALVHDAVGFYIAPGEAWSDQARRDLDAMGDDARAAWNRLIQLAQTASGAKPSSKWKKSARQHLDAVGREEFIAQLVRWLPLIDQRRTQPDPHPAPWGEIYDQSIIVPHQDLLKGLVWIAGAAELSELIGPLTRLAISSYRKLRAVGARAPSVGNACAISLARMPGRDGVAALARLKVKVRHRAFQNNVDKLLNQQAERSGISVDELCEMSVPSCGLIEVGRLVEPLGEYTAELTVTGTASTELRFRTPAGKTIQSVPAALKESYADEVKEIQAASKEIRTLLPVQRERLDQLYRSRRTWDLATWREHYLDHPLVGTLARRLIWNIAPEGAPTLEALYRDGSLRGVNDAPIDPPDDAIVSLWHPIDPPLDRVLAWRDTLDRHQVQQPFKQAHREVYVLTDAERGTGAYSNRFAAHILKQHPFNALCGVRGWKNSLRLMVDDDYPPAHLELPAFGLRAELWVEAIPGDDAVNDTFVYDHVVTDQVRFYPIAAPKPHAHAGGGGYRFSPDDDGEATEPIPQGQVPPLVFSEVMRDVDLFVGVSSVGNDPTWHDGGPDGHRRYWESYAFGDLSASARSRRELLERLIPRLKLRDRCSFSDRFLIVRGNLRTYKIHLGSANIRMEPDDRYLCIVPMAAAVTAATGKVFLPFEGDRTLAIVLSKAFLLADDDKIKDPTIRSQIDGS